MRNFIKQTVLKGLWKAGQRILTNDQPFVIAVTGSVGKTTTKDAIYHLLKGASKNKVRRAVGNLNTEFGVPLAIAGFEKVPKGAWQWLLACLKIINKKTSGVKGGYLVLEFSSDKAGDIAFLAEKVPVDVAVFTRFTLAHSGETVEDVTKEKLSLLNGLARGGITVLNADDKQQITNIKSGRKVSYSLDGKGDVTINKIELSLEGSKATLMYMGRGQKIQSKLIATHQLQSIAAAVAVGVSQGIDIKKLISQISTFEAPNGRMKIIKGRKSITIIDDTYNSSPAAASEAIDTLKALSAQNDGGRSVAILGNMNELGKNTVAAHIEMGKQVAAADIGYLVAVGPNAKRIIRGAREGGMEEAHLIDFLKPEKLIAHLDALIQSKDIILVKASQNGMRLERVVKVLMANPKQAKELLVRQD